MQVAFKTVVPTTSLLWLIAFFFFFNSTVLTTEFIDKKVLPFSRRKKKREICKYLEWVRYSMVTPPLSLLQRCYRACWMPVNRADHFKLINTFWWLQCYFIFKGVIHHWQNWLWINLGCLCGKKLKKLKSVLPN